MRCRHCGASGAGLLAPRHTAALLATPLSGLPEHPGFPASTPSSRCPASAFSFLRGRHCALPGRLVERLIFGDGDDAEIEAVISRFAEVELGSAVEVTLSKPTSGGLVTGVLPAVAFLGAKRPSVRPAVPAPRAGLATVGRPTA